MEDGKVVHELTIGVAPIQIASLVHAVIPGWLKDSRVPIPMNDAIDPIEAKGKAQLLETGRIGMKSFVAASGMLQSMVHDLYGPNEDVKPRADSLPVVSQWMSWFVAAQIAKSPIEIVIEDGIIRDIRQSVGVPVQAHNSDTPCDNC